MIRTPVTALAFAATVSVNVTPVVADSTEASCERGRDRGDML
jgi:hypothetical protein